MRRLQSIACAVVVVLTVGFSATAASARPPDRQTVELPGFGDLPAGVACVFPVSLNPVEPVLGNQLTFFDRDGNVVRQATTAGPGTWKITYLDTNASYTFTGPGGRTNVKPHADGSVTIEISGGIIGFNTPTDTPPGPFTLTISGHLVVNVAADGTGTIIQLSGTTTDLCAKVAP
jgi:hypothetical protein